jgi:Mannosyl-glycoprotein endo-beta-N-acetylglucosaminidase
VALATLFSALAACFVVLPPPASSQADPVVLARERLANAQADAEGVRDRHAQAVTEHEQAQVQITELEQRIPELRAHESHLRSDLARRAVALYKSAGASSRVSALDVDDVMDAGRKTKFTVAADDLDERRAQELREKADQLQQVELDLRGKRTELDDLVTRLENDQSRLEEKVARANRGLEIAEKLAPLRAAGDPVMGPAVLNATEMAAWLRSTSSSPRLSGDVTLEQIAQIFVDEGTAENVRGDVAFAQAYIETGGFRAGGSENNFSGLGACDGCGGQNRFPNALEGIRAQMQLLKAYAGGGPLVNPASPYWWSGDPARAYGSFGGTGSARTWRQMGGGKWASDPNYSSKVLGTYDRMIQAATGS